MKANELRIGNLITQIIHKDTHDQEIEIKVNWQEIWWISKGTNSYKPIPLTEEWLLKFGFKKIQGYICGEKIVYYYVKEDLEYDLTSGECMIENFTINLDKVHEMQNLYFAIYSEELILKP